MKSEITRRDFVMTGAAAALAASTRAHAADVVNDRVRIGVIGAGNRGSQLIDATLPHKDAQIVALCDVFEPYIDRESEKIEGKVDRYTDYRKMLERNDIDAVLIATPDHWHALQTIDACEAGKDVYVEKPMSYTIVEGRKMVEVARRNNSVVQVGTHRRASKMYAHLAEFIQGGGIGTVTAMRAYRLSNMAPNGIGFQDDSEAPDNLDWDMWLGPRPDRPYNANIAPYRFRWWKDYSSQMTNWGNHYFDLMRWLVGEEYIESCSAHGGRFAVNDQRSIPDTMEATFEFASGKLMLFGQYEANGAPMFPGGAEVEFRGTKGTLYAGGRGYTIRPERGGQFQDSKPRMDEIKEESQDGNANLTQEHIRDFLDCVKSRNKPKADVEIGHRSTTIALLGNIALEAKARINWDGENERITSPESANDLLHYEYREPWKLA
jgi:predicted dehydrogenase